MSISEEYILGFGEHMDSWIMPVSEEYMLGFSEHMYSRHYHARI